MQQASYSTAAESNIMKYFCEDEERRSLPSKTRERLDALCEQINSLSPESRGEAEKHIATILMMHLKAEDQRDVAQRIGLPSPNQNIADKLWMIVVVSFVCIMVVSAVALVAATFLMKVEYTLLLTIFTAVSAFLIGLFCPRSKTFTS
jgi:hypothetical protein